MKKQAAKFLLSGIVGISILADGFFTLIKPNAIGASNTPVTTEEAASSSSTRAQTSSAVSTSTNSTSSADDTDTDTTSSSTENTSNSTDDDTYKDGTYTGESTSTRWGDVQVKITVVSGKLSAIDVLSYPDSEQKSISINNSALPTYKQEAISAQSSSIQQISGATETYKGFTGSLQDALNQAL